MDHDAVALAAVNPAMKTTARARVPENGIETSLGLLKVMQHADAIDEVELTEVCSREISPMQFEHAVGQMPEILARLSERVA